MRLLLFLPDGFFSSSRFRREFIKNKIQQNKQKFIHFTYLIYFNFTSPE